MHFTRRGVSLPSIAGIAAAVLSLGGVAASRFSPLPHILALKDHFLLAAALLGLGLWLAAATYLDRNRIWVVRSLGLTGAWIGAVALVETFFGRVLDMEAFVALYSTPNHLSLSEASVVLLLSVALTLLPSARRVAAGQALAVAALTFCFFNAVANLYGVPHLYGTARFSAMPVAVSLTGICLSFALLALRPTRGPIRLLTQPGPGGALVRRLLPAAIFLPVALGALRLAGELLGLFDNRFGLTLLVITFILAFSALILLAGQMLNRLDSGRVRAVSRLAHSELEYRSVVESLPQMVWTCLPSGECDYLNERWLSYTGAPISEQLGSGWLRFVHSDDITPIYSKWSRSVTTGQPMDGEYRVLGTNGQYRWFRALAVPVRDAAGSITKWFGSSTDIHEAKTAASDLLQSRALLEQRVAARTNELADAKAQLQSVLDAATQVAIIAVDNNFTIQVFNAGAEKLLGYSAAEIVGKASPALFFDPLELDGRRALLPPDRVRTGTLSDFLDTSGRSDPAIWTYLRKNGSRVSVQLAVTPILDSHGVSQGTLGISVDVSDRIAMETRLRTKAESLRQAHQEAESANRAKSEFLANMSHEIRTPMNGVIGMTGLLLDTELSQEQRLFGETIRASGESLLVVLNDILDFSKIEAGKMELELLDFDLRTTVESALQLLATRADEKNLELTCHIDPALPPSVFGDPGRLRQVLLNLLGNAIKFTAAGAVTLYAAADADDPALVRFSISDTGIGIPADRLTSLFQAFAQVDASVTRKFGGTGLGLAISRNLATLMGGTIGVHSQLGQGSTFWFTARLIHAHAVTDPLTPAPLASLAGLRALIVDDAETNRLLLVNLLLGWGCLFEQTRSPQEALNVLRRAAQLGTPFDVALIDYRMPELNGDELGRLIKADPLCRNTHLILLTSISQRGQGREAASAGFAGFLTKPIRQDDLHHILATTAGRKAAPACPLLPPPLITQHSIQESRQRRGRILLAEDNHTNQMVAIAMVRKLGYWIEAVANGAEAIQALRSAPYDLVLMDCQMPELDGITATLMIRSGTAGVPNPRIPIIALTASVMRGDRERCLAAGMDAYLSKPVNARELAEVILRWLPGPSPASPAPGASESSMS